MLTGSLLVPIFFPYINQIIFYTLFSIFVRSAAVDSSGRELNRNRLIALMSAIVLEDVWFPHYHN